MTTEYDVAVVGAGASGLTAARDLRDRGHSVLMLEARDRLGGRTYTRTLRGYDAERIEVGGTYIHPTLQHNLDREIRRYDQPLAVGVGGLESAAFLVGGKLRRLPVPAEQLVAVERAIIAMADAARRIDTNSRVSDQHLSDLDVPIETFLAPLRLPAETREFLYGVIAAVVQCDVHEVSMLQWLVWMAGLGSPVSAFFGVADEKLKDGMSALWSAMADDAGADIAFGADVTAIIDEHGSVSVRTADGGVHRAKVCVVAMGSQVLNRIEFSPGLGDDRRALIDGVYVAPGFKNFLVVENAPRGFIGFGGFGGSRDPTINWVFEDRELPDGRLLLVVWGIGESLLDRPQDAQAALVEYLPEAVVVSSDGHDWARDEHANGINHFRRPGEAMRFASVVGRRHGHMLFAGTDMTPGIWNGWIEGAVDSGRIAAEQAAALLRSGMP